MDLPEFDLSVSSLCKTGIHTTLNFCSLHFSFLFYLSLLRPCTTTNQMVARWHFEEQHSVLVYQLRYGVFFRPNMGISGKSLIKYVHKYINRHILYAAKHMGEQNEGWIRNKKTSEKTFRINVSKIW